MRVNRYGVSSILMTQPQTSPSVVRLTLQVNKNSPDWQATVSRFGGIVLLPTRSIAAATVVNTRSQSRNNEEEFPPTRPAKQISQVAIVESVELTGNGTQLLIKSNQNLIYTSGWDRSSGFYSITLPNAQLAKSVKGQILMPTVLYSGCACGVDPTTVVIFVQPASGVRIGELNQPGRELLSLQLQRFSTVLVPPPPLQVPLFQHQLLRHRHPHCQGLQKGSL